MIIEGFLSQQFYAKKRRQKVKMKRNQRRNQTNWH